MKFEWRFVAPNAVDVGIWSRSIVEAMADLYSAAIFGAARALTCDCGALQGPDVVGLVCSLCRVQVAADADIERRTNIGKIQLACYIDHPLVWRSRPDPPPDELPWIDVVPVAPLAYRVDPLGKPNQLGRKYEKLLEANQTAARELPVRGTAAWVLAENDFDKGPLHRALDAILGLPPKGEAPTIDLADTSSLLPLLFSGILRLDPLVSTLARCCLLSLKVSAQL